MYRTWSPTAWLSALVNFFLVLVESLLILRIFLRLFNANGNNSFVSWIYTTSGSIMDPFRGIFHVAILGNGVVLDVPAIFAMIIYGLIGFLILALIGLIPTPWVARDVRDRRR
jgi:uncharacterized protein YggT (Ycf19 family)